jgi:uncharacterized protein (DUF1697 family)
VAKTSPAAADTFVALLRGINVGGKNKLPMRDLAALCTKLGCREVRTYIQSGNVVFAAAPRTAARFAAGLQRGITSKFGLNVPVVVRSSSQLRAVVAGNPWISRGVDAEQLHVAFLADLPARVSVAGLDPKRSPGDAFVVAGQEVYLHLPNGVARSKLTNAWFDAQLDTVSTIRNWRTVLTLLEWTTARP